MKQLLEQSKHFMKTDSKQSVLTASSFPLYRKYNKITFSIRTTFLNLIINGNTTIKKAAKLLNINYSSAKTIVAEYRKEAERKFKISRPETAGQCEFRKIEKGCVPNIVLVTSVGNTNNFEKELFESFSGASKVAVHHNIGSKLGHCQ